jgi:hypothetical protein
LVIFVFLRRLSLPLRVFLWVLFGLQVVQKSAVQLLSELSDVDLGYLPSGTPLLSLLVQAALDEAGLGGLGTTEALRNWTAAEAVSAIEKRAKASGGAGAAVEAPVQPTKGKGGKGRGPPRYSFAGADGRSTNTLVRILERVSDIDVRTLQDGVRQTSQFYRY